jgi:hypothetical protein
VAVNVTPATTRLALGLPLCLVAGLALVAPACSDNDDPTPAPTTIAGELGSIDGPASVDSGVVASQP